MSYTNDGSIRSMYYHGRRIGRMFLGHDYDAEANFRDNCVPVVPQGMAWLDDGKREAFWQGFDDVVHHDFFTVKWSGVIEPPFWGEADSDPWTAMLREKAEALA